MGIQHKMLKVLNRYHGDNDFHTNPQIPAEIEHYARAALDIPDDEYVMALMRTSFSKFVRGLVIGRDGIYWLNGPEVKTDVNRLTWRELSERKAGFKTSPTTLILGEDAVFNNKGSLNKPAIVMNVLDLVIEVYDSQEEDSDGFIFDPESESEIVRSIPDNKAELKAIIVAQNEDPDGFITGLFKKFFKK